MALYQFIKYEGISKIFRTNAVKILKIINKCVWKLPTSTQLRASWHTDSLDMVVLPSTGASRYNNCCIDGGNSPECFGYTLVHCRQIMKDNLRSAWLKRVYFTVQLIWLEGDRAVMSVCICSCVTNLGNNYLTKQSGLFLEMLIVSKPANNFTVCYTTNSSSSRRQRLASGPHP
jgi:hypothetical protein